MRRPDSTDSRGGKESPRTFSGRTYVQRLSVQVPGKTEIVSPICGSARNTGSIASGSVNVAGISDTDVLRLIIHVEESRTRSDSLVDPAVACSQTETNGARIIHRQRSASLETTSLAGLTPTQLVKNANQVPRRSASLCLDTSFMHSECDSSSSLAAEAASFSASPGLAIVKELRRSSELMRNILLGLSSPCSSDSSVSTKEKRKPSLSNSRSARTADLQMALQAHRQQRWLSGASANTNNSNPLESSVSSRALFRAIAANDVARTRWLLDRGVDPNAPNETGLSPLHWCIEQTPPPWPCILILIEHGSVVQLHDQDESKVPHQQTNLCRVQQQLIKDAVQYLRGSMSDLRPEESPAANANSGSCRDGRDRDSHRAAANLFRRLQQGATRSKQPLAKLKSKDLSDPPEECCTFKVSKQLLIKIEYQQ